MGYMVETKHMNDKVFQRLTDSFADCRNVFPGYTHKVANALDVATEICGYIRERELADEDSRSLEEIGRDVLIFRSRVSKLFKKLEGLYEELALIEVARKDLLNKDAEIQNWFARFCTWLEDQRYFHSSFRVAEHKWVTIENGILEKHQ